MQERNNLYPIFLKTSQLNILIVGGGYVALEKLTFLLKSSPDAKVKLVAPFFRAETIEFVNLHNIKLIKKNTIQSFLLANILLLPLQIVRLSTFKFITIVKSIIYW